MGRFETKSFLAWAFMVAALTVYSVATAQMLLKVEPFYSWYYCFAWWSYIFFVESFLHLRRGVSTLFGDPSRFLVQLPLSVTVWLIFEGFNFRLNNWHYLELVRGWELRWIGYTVSFATVLPGVFATERLLDSLGVARGRRCMPLGNARRLYRPFLYAGIFSAAAPLLWPEFFFPFVWLAFMFLLEPLNHRSNGVSLLRDWEEGSPRRVLLLLLAGLICGFLWEFWNYWAGSKWLYTVPYVSYAKVFEMPLLGFLGFPPFALECYVMANSFFLLDRIMKERLPPERLRRMRVAMGVGVVLFDGLIFWGIDHLTVISWEG